MKAVEVSRLKCNLICVLLMDRSTVTRSERQPSHFERIWHLSEQMNPISRTTASGLSVPAWEDYAALVLWPWHFNNFMSSTAFVIAPNSVRVWRQKEMRLLWDSCLADRWIFAQWGTQVDGAVLLPHNVAAVKPFNGDCNCDQGLKAYFTSQGF